MYVCVFCKTSQDKRHVSYARHLTSVNSVLNISDVPRQKCILSCCHICSFCHHTATKERLKFLVKINKFCQRCFLCTSVVFCPTCCQFPHCCSKGSRLTHIWQAWVTLGASPKVILKEGYTLSFWNQPPLSRSPIIISGYIHPLRHSYLWKHYIHLCKSKQ